MPAPDSIRIEPWGEDDLGLLERLVGDSAMMEHLGGSETPDKITERQARDARSGSRQFRIVYENSGEAVGWVGYWDRPWRGEDVYEIGWSALPGHHGRRIASRATGLLLEIAAGETARRYVHAFPSVGNAPSNAICRRAGFVLLAEVDFEYPPGHVMRCNDWRLDLASRPTGRS